MHDLVEWAAQQPLCDGNVGTIGISCFAMTQMEAAVERPRHLKAIMPIASTFDSTSRRPITDWSAAAFSLPSSSWSA
jgi:predicted acyl esterase